MKTQPDRLIDVAGDIKIDQNIYDSDNNPGQDGYSYQNLMVSAGAAPDAFRWFLCKKGINVGVGSFTL